MPPLAPVTPPSLVPMPLHDEQTLLTLVSLWNGVAPSALQCSRRLVDYNLQPIRDGVQAGWFAMQADHVVGAVIASLLRDHPAVADPQAGWIDFLAVATDEQRQGVGTALLRVAEAWLHQQGCTTVQVGASLQPFAPGVPTELETLPFFTRQGYVTVRQVWDVAANLATYQPPDLVREIPGLVRPAQSADAAPLAEFLRREFPGRWHFAYASAQADERHRLSDYMVLWTERGIDGFCQLTFADSYRPLERYYPYDLPRPWGQLGPIGVSADRRRQGFGAALLDAGLRRLHNNGINGCVIDWTTLLAYYAHFGFQPYRTYAQLRKMLD